ncbi:MAG: chloromuconate cycloisomerase [Cytophagaceae bacterium]|jgi:o-succinylbenzoate synthase|nr:chloromuconate cycloisomerase [Cytophagaceae bacterium]
MFNATVHPLVFRFAFEAGTSRGVLREKTSWFIRLNNKGIEGWGECSPIAGLSPEPLEIIEAKIVTVLDEWQKDPASILDPDARWTEELSKWPSLRFALETAWLDYNHGGQHKIYNNDFVKGKQAVPINGLVWMNTLEHMQDQIEDKLKQGYRCIKLKIGHHDVASELGVLKKLRDRFSSKELMIRVDANGAYEKDTVYPVLEALAQLDVHSIEQPIAAGQASFMADLCRNSPVPVALDEELIAHCATEERSELLDQLRPAYLVLKPSLHGGMLGCKDWIKRAAEHHIGWWMTSYLESSIGLNAIAQFTCEYDTTIFHGLGTGQIYTHNVASPLEVRTGNLTYDTLKHWGSPLNLI